MSLLNQFYKKAWQVLFIICYPFITLFSLLFIGLVSLISAVSSLFASSQEEQVTEAATTATQDRFAPWVQHHGLYLSRKAVHEVQFGPVLYHLRANPPQNALQTAYWSEFNVSIGEGFLLQRWPSIAEHELESFELVYVRPGLDDPLLLHTIPTFYWQTHEISHEEVELRWNEDGEEKSLLINEAQLP